MGKLESAHFARNVGDALVIICVAAVACTASGEVARFSEVPFAVPHGSAASVIDAEHMWVGLVYTADGGKSWSARVPDVPDPREFNVVGGPDQQLTRFITEKRGWLSWRSVWQTEDHGATWVRLFDGNLRTVAFSHDGAGWMAVGDDRNYENYVTKDWGITWRECGGKQPVSEGVPMGSATFVDSSTGWTTFAKLNSRTLPVPPEGVAKTTDGGCTWNPVWWNSETLPYPFADLVFVDRLTGWLVITGKGGLFKTVTGGESWKRLPMPGGDFNLDSAYTVDGERGWILGSWAGEPLDGSDVYYTEDSGSHWASVSSSDLKRGEGRASQIPVAWRDGFAVKVLSR